MGHGSGRGRGRGAGPCKGTGAGTLSWHEHRKFRKACLQSLRGLPVNLLLTAGADVCPQTRVDRFHGGGGRHAAMGFACALGLYMELGLAAQQASARQMAQQSVASAAATAPHTSTHGTPKSHGRALVRQAAGLPPSTTHEYAAAAAAPEEQLLARAHDAHGSLAVLDVRRCSLLPAGAVLGCALGSWWFSPHAWPTPDAQPRRCSSLPQALRAGCVDGSCGHSPRERLLCAYVSGAQRLMQALRLQRLFADTSEEPESGARQSEAGGVPVAVGAACSARPGCAALVRSCALEPGGRPHPQALACTAGALHALFFQLQVWPAERPNDGSYFVGDVRPRELAAPEGRVDAFCQLHGVGCAFQELCVFALLELGVGAQLLSLLERGALYAPPPSVHASVASDNHSRACLPLFPL